MTDTTPRPAMRARGVRRANKELVLDALRIESGSPLTRAELSNVDLGQEFIELILTSTGYSASSRIIQTADELIQQLLLLGR